MDWFELIERIKSVLNRNSYPEIANIILDAQLTGGTPGETLTIVCSKLLTIKDRDEAVFTLIEAEANELLNYARTLGYNIVAT